MFNPKHNVVAGDKVRLIRFIACTQLSQTEKDAIGKTFIVVSHLGDGVPYPFAVGRGREMEFLLKREEFIKVE